jgi:hypothetical protein
MIIISPAPHPYSSRSGLEFDRLAIEVDQLRRLPAINQPPSFINPGDKPPLTQLPAAKPPA